jgi:tetratricopeptide (TPR) repeat protein
LPAFEEAESQWKKGEQESSIALFEQLIQESVKFLGNLYAQRGDSLVKVGDLDAAISHLKHAIRCNVTDRFATRSYHQALNRKATELFKARRFTDARTVIREGLALDPKCTGCQQVAAQIEREIQNASRGGLFSKKKRRR